MGAIDFEVYDAFGDSELGEVFTVLLLGPIHILVTLAMLAAMAALKWSLIGRWSTGDRHFYSWFHFRWAALMVAFSSLDDLLDEICGTWLASLYLRLMGAYVGHNVCFFGHGFEYDLLHIGDHVCIGDSCDVTAHTVENMVMRMEPVRFEQGASCMGGSIVMPGGQMEPWSTLIEHSQVLKGEAVPAGSLFGGLPAHPLPSSYPWAFGLSGDGSSGMSSSREIMALCSNESPRPFSSQGIFARMWPLAPSASTQPSSMRLLDSSEAAATDMDDLGSLLPSSSSVHHPRPHSDFSYVGFDVYDSSEAQSNRGQRGGGSGGFFSRLLGH